MANETRTCDLCGAPAYLHPEGDGTCSYSPAPCPRCAELEARIVELESALESVLDDMEPSGLASYRWGRMVLGEDG